MLITLGEYAFGRNNVDITVSTEFRRIESKTRKVQNLVLLVKLPLVHA